MNKKTHVTLCIVAPAFPVRPQPCDQTRSNATGRYERRVPGSVPCLGKQDFQRHDTRGCEQLFRRRRFVFLLFQFLFLSSASISKYKLHFVSCTIQFAEVCAVMESFGKALRSGKLPPMISGFQAARTFRLHNIMAEEFESFLESLQQNADRFLSLPDDQQVERDLQREVESFLALVQEKAGLPSSSPLPQLPEVMLRRITRFQEELRRKRQEQSEEKLLEHVQEIKRNICQTAASQHEVGARTLTSLSGVYTPGIQRLKTFPSVHLAQHLPQVVESASEAVMVCSFSLFLFLLAK